MQYNKTFIAKGEKKDKIGTQKDGDKEEREKTEGD